MLNTFTGSSAKSMSEVTLTVSFKKNENFQLPFLVDPTFSIDMEIPMLTEAITNLQNNNFKLANTFDQKSNKIAINCLLGVDFLQHLSQFSIIKCINGSAFLTSNGIIPFGNVSSFLKQIPSVVKIPETKPTFLTSNGKIPFGNVSSLLKPKSSDVKIPEPKPTFITSNGKIPFGNVSPLLKPKSSDVKIPEIHYLKSSDATVPDFYFSDHSIPEYPQFSDDESPESYLSDDQMPETQHNFSDVQIDATNYQKSNFVEQIATQVISPVHSYFTPISEPSDLDSYIETGLEKMFNLESIGINSKESTTTVNDQMSKQFLSTLQLHNNNYLVEIPWKDNISEVPSHSNIALAVLNRVHKKLAAQGLLPEYNNIFQKQLAAGIIDQIHVKPEHYSNYIWIPTELF